MRSQPPNPFFRRLLGIWLVSAGAALAACAEPEPTLVADVFALPPDSTELRVLVHLDKVSAEQPLSFPLGELAGQSATNLGLRLPAHAVGAELSVGVAALDAAGHIIAAGSQREGSLIVEGGSQGEQHVHIELTAVKPRLAGPGPLLLHADPPLLSTAGKDSAGVPQRLRILGWGFTPKTRVWVGGQRADALRWKSGVELSVKVSSQPGRLGVVRLEAEEYGSPADLRADLFSYFAEQIDFVSERSFYGIRGSIQAVSTGDFNEDGHLDLMILYYGNSISVWLGDGHGSFASMLNSPEIKVSGFPPPSFLAVGDATGDGHLDAIVPCDARLCLLRGKGTGTFEHPPQILEAEGQPDFAWIGDLNEDSIPDIVLHVPSTRAVSILFGAGGNRFLAPRRTVLNVDVMTVADVNRDGDLDLVLGGYKDDIQYLTLLLATGPGKFEGGVSRHLGFRSDPFRLTVDLSRTDGRTDILVTSPGVLRILTFDKGLAFERETSPDDPRIALGDVTAIDMTGDRRIDALIDARCNAGLLLNQGGGILTAAGKVPRCLNALGKFRGVGDFDEDGSLDLIIGDDTISILPGQPDGHYRSAAEYAASAGAIAANRMIVADFSHRGAPSVYTFGDNATQVLESNEDGTLREPKALPGVISGIDAFAGDFNADGNLDLTFVSPVPLQAVVVKTYLGDGGGGFGGVVQSTCVVGSIRQLSPYMTPAFVAELTGDRFPDLAIKGKMGIRVLVGRGDGSFESGAAIDFGYDLTDAIAANVNRDPRAELIGISRDSELVTIKQISGAGEATQLSEYPVIIGPARIVAEDFNGDQKIDLFLAEVENRTALLFGDGAGGFGQPILGAAAQGASGPAIGDFNGDGLLDVATSNLGPNLILRNRGGGVLEPSPQGYSSHCSFRVADLNRDRLPDLLCLDDNRIKVVLNVSR